MERERGEGSGTAYDLPQTPKPGYNPPMAKLTLIESEFPTTEEAEAHDAWVRAKVEAALVSPHPTVPHDEVMAEIRQMLDAKRGATTRLAG